MSERSPMKRLDGEIRRELGRFGPGEGPTGRAGTGGELTAIVAAWPAAVGAENARRAWPARLGRDGTLLVHASDSVWAFQLGMLADAIHERLVAALGETAPTSLRFVPGPIPGRVAKPTREQPPERLAVGREETERGARIAAGIEDDELRETVARAAAASLARAESGRAF